MKYKIQKSFSIVLLLLFFCKIVIGQCSEYDIINLKKIAIVFGEKDYKYAGALTNPLNDAQDISDSLKKMGFIVYTYYNTDFKTMKTTIEDWYKKITKYDVALFYYSGHGAEVNGENYLFPVDANPQGPSDLHYMAYSANRLLSNMEANNSKYNILILDACRNNPFTKSWVRGIKGGLASMTGRGSFIGFAASPGTTASDGDKRNGTYTEAILKNITTPNLTIDQIFTRVNSYVRSKSSEKQVPYKNSSLSTDFCFSVRSEKLTNGLTKSTFIQPASQILLSPNDEKIFVNDSANGGLVTKDSKTLNTLNAILSKKNNPYKITARRGESIYVIDSTSKSLIIIDSKSGIVNATILLQNTPLSIAISDDEHKAYISNHRSATDGSIDVIDLAQKKIIKTIATNICSNGIVVSQNGKYLYATSECNNPKRQLLVIETKTDKIIKYIDSVASGEAIGVAPDNKKIYVSDNEGGSKDQINVLEAGSFKIQKILGFRAFSFSFSSDGKYVFALGKSEIAIIRTADDVIINKLPFATPPKGIAVSDDGRFFVWLPLEHRTIVLPIIEYLQSENNVDYETNFKEFKEEIKKQSNSDIRYKFEEQFRQAHNTLYLVINQLIAELGLQYSNIQTGIERNYDEAFYSNKYGIISKFDKSKTIWPVYKATFTENLVIISMKEDESEEIFKAPINDINWDKVKGFIRNFFIKRINQLR